MAEDKDIIRARQARELAKKFSEQRAASANSLAELQAGIAASKEQVKAKNIEIPTIALEQAVNSGDVAAIQAAATNLGKAQGLAGSDLRTFAYNTAQTAAKGEKPTPPPADNQYIYDYVWRQDIGGPGGKWVLVKSPNPNPKSSSAAPFDVNSLIPKENNGSPLTESKWDEESGWLIAYYADGSKKYIYRDPNKQKKTNQSDKDTLAAQQLAQKEAEDRRRAGQSAWDFLFSEFDSYGMGALVEPLKAFISEGLSPAELTLRLRETDAYKKRFAANAQRIAKGLRALSEAEYVGLEDAYQEKMRQYGLPESYYTKGEMGRQAGFEKLIAGGVAPTELEDRLQTAYDRVINAAPEVSQALKQFYPDITNGDVLAFVLDPENARDTIKRKVTAAEIGAGALQAGLATGLSRAEELQRYGVTGEAARQGYQAIAGYLPRASTLGSIYAKQGMGPFTQATAEAETFGTPGAVEAAQKRRKLSELEQAQFSGQAGRAGGALARERAGQF